jgi:transketolase
MQRGLPFDWEKHLPVFEATSKGLATRKANTPILNSLAPVFTELMGGSADLTSSVITRIDGSQDYEPGQYQGRNVRFGVREHAMGAIMNGMALHGGILPYGGTYLTFYDYMRPPVRLAAMMKLPVIFVFAHDSLALGEDGPTHQPVEHMFGLRSVPDLTMIRPCDANEASEAWKFAVGNKQGPTSLVLSRQGLPVLDRSKYAPASALKYGAYILSEPQGGQPQIILIGTGSEVHLALEVQSRLCEKGIRARVVSMPSWELFQAQPAFYREEVLPRHIKARIAIEAGSTLGWERWVGDQGKIIGIDRFGISAPAKRLLQEMGFSAEPIVNVALEMLSNDGILS